MLNVKEIHLIIRKIWKNKRIQLYLKTSYVVGKGQLWHKIIILVGTYEQI